MCFDLRQGRFFFCDRVTHLVDLGKKREDERKAGASGCLMGFLNIYPCQNAHKAHGILGRSIIHPKVENLGSWGVGVLG